MDQIGLRVQQNTGLSHGMKTCQKTIEAYLGFVVVFSYNKTIWFPFEAAVLHVSETTISTHFTCFLSRSSI